MPAYRKYFVLKSAQTCGHVFFLYICVWVVFFLFKEFKQLPTWIALIHKCLSPQFDDDFPLMDRFHFAKCQKMG